MKRNQNRGVVVKFGIVLFSLLCFFIIHSCKKNQSPIEANTVLKKTADISKLKAAYTTDTTARRLTVFDINPSVSAMISNLNVQWDSLHTQQRKKSKVTEFELSKAPDLWTFGSTPAKSANKNSVVFLEFEDGTTVNFYMKVMEDLTTDPISKINGVHYTSIPQGFNGQVMYYTINKRFVNGFNYTNGKITGTYAPAGVNNNSGQQVLSLGPIKTNDYYTVCTEAYNYNYPAGHPEQGTWVDSGYRECNFYYVPDNNNSPTIGTIAPDDPPGGYGGDPGAGTYIGTYGRIFGINGSNAQVPDANFDDLLDYVKNTLHLEVSNPYNVVMTINGINYTGQMTDIYNPDGTVVYYFSPDLTGGPFQLGMEYAIGQGYEISNNINTSNITMGGILVGNNSPSLGNSVTYTPVGGGGAILSREQRQQMETADNNRILQLLQQEDAADDAAASPCHGTARNGNARWPGTVEHWMIQYDYMANNPSALREYYVPGSSGQLNGNPGYADIVNPTTGEMYEIKPDNTSGQTAGINEIQLYVTQANALCPRIVGGGWFAGGGYTTRYLPSPTPGFTLVSRLFSNGVIVYSSKPNNEVPQSVPVLLPENLLEKIKNLFRQIKLNPTNMQQQIVTFVRANPRIIPYLKSASAGVIVATLLEDIATDGAGILDDWQSF